MQVARHTTCSARSSPPASSSGCPPPTTPHTPTPHNSCVSHQQQAPQAGRGGSPSQQACRGGAGHHLHCGLCGVGAVCQHCRPLHCRRSGWWWGRSSTTSTCSTTFRLLACGNIHTNNVQQGCTLHLYRNLSRSQMRCRAHAETTYACKHRQLAAPTHPRPVHASPLTLWCQQRQRPQRALDDAQRPADVVCSGGVLAKDPQRGAAHAGRPARVYQCQYVRVGAHESCTPPHRSQHKATSTAA